MQLCPELILVQCQKIVGPNLEVDGVDGAVSCRACFFT